MRLLGTNFSSSGLCKKSIKASLKWQVTRWAKRQKQEANYLKCRKTNTCEPLGKCTVISKIHMCTINLWDDSKLQKICTWTVSKNKDKVVKLEFFSSWRTVWLTCTNKSEGCINKHQCDLQNISKIKHKCKNPPPSIIHCLATNQRYVLWIVDFLVVSKLW